MISSIASALCFREQQQHPPVVLLCSIILQHCDLIPSESLGAPYNLPRNADCISAESPSWSLGLGVWTSSLIRSAVFFKANKSYGEGPKLYSDLTEDQSTRGLAMLTRMQLLKIVVPIPYGIRFFMGCSGWYSQCCIR